MSIIEFRDIGFIVDFLTTTKIPKSRFEGIIKRIQENSSGYLCPVCKEKTAIEIENDDLHHYSRYLCTKDECRISYTKDWDNNIVLGQRYKKYEMKTNIKKDFVSKGETLN